MPKNYLSGSVQIRNGVWYYRVRLPDGTDTRRKVGPAWRGKEPAPDGFFTERDARRELDKLLSRYEGYTTGSDPLFQYAAEEFLTACAEKGLRKTTTSRYAQILRHDLIPTLGQRKLSTITEDMICDLRADLSRRVSASSMNQIRIILSGVVKHAKRARKYRGEDFSAFFDRAKIKQRTHIDVYSPAEVEQLARTVRAGVHREQRDRLRPLSPSEIAENARMDDQDAVIFKTAAYAGLRLSEIRAMKWRDIDFAGAKITIRSGYTDQGKEDAPKSGRARTVPMTSRLATELDHLSRREHFVAEGDLVFCNATGGHLSGSALYRRFVAAAQSAGLRRLRFHDLRHTFGTTMVQRFPLSDVQAMLGHADPSTTLVYVHHIPRHSDAAKIDSLLDSELNELPAERAIKEVMP